MTNAKIAWPVMSSFLPTTAASATERWSTSADFDLGRGDPVARHVHHVVHPAEEPEIAIHVALRAVAREVHPGKAAPVRLPVALRIAVDATQHRGPRPLEDEVPTTTERDRFTVGVDHVRRDPRERERGRARFGRRHPGQRRDHDLAGLGLPPGIDDRRATAADVLAVPQPRLRVDRLTHRPEHTQRREVVTPGPVLTLLHECPDRGRGAVQDRDLVVLDDLPPAVPRRRVGRSLVQQPCRRRSPAGHTRCSECPVTQPMSAAHQ